MLVLEAIILGIVQGLTEFIPVSSSAHLLIIPKLLGWKDMGLPFDVALHLGSLAALIIYFRRDWAGILSSFGRHVFKGVCYTKDADPGKSGRLLVPIIVACVPAGVAGLLFDKKVESLRDSAGTLVLIACVLVAIGGVMLLADKLGKKRRDIVGMGFVDCLVIGCAQALALFPGVSRSGITISAGLMLGLNREAAARFSFLLSTPIILGAGLLSLSKIAKHGLPANEMAPFAIGIVTATAAGYLAINFLMNYLKKHSLAGFVVYRACLAVVLVVGALAHR